MFKTIIFWSFVGLLFITPLVFTPYNFELFEFNKTLVLFAFTTIIGLSWLADTIYHRRLLYRRTPLTIPFGLFTLTQLISTIYSSDQYMSLWGYYSRFHQSLLHTIAYFILYLAFVTWMDKKDSIKLVLTISICVFLVSLYGVAQHFGIDAKYWVQDVKNRVFATLGQPNWLAAYLVSFIFLTYEYLKSKSSLLAGTFFTLTLTTLLFTKSKSGWLALMGGWLIWGLIQIMNRKQITPAPKFKLLLTPSLLIILLSFIIWNPSKIYLKTIIPKSPSPAQVQSSPQNQALLITPSSTIRKIVWQGAIDLWRLNTKNLLIGTGVETFAFNYYLTRPAVHNLTSEWDYIYNKAHNEYINFLTTTGIVGLLAYLLYLFTGLIVIIRSSARYKAGLAGGYIGLMISNFFGFSVVPTAINLTLLPALAISLSHSDKISKPAPKPDQNTLTYVSFGLLIFVGVKIIWSLIGWWRADYYLTKGRRSFKQEQYLSAINLYQKAVELAPHPIYTIHLAEALTYKWLAYQNQIKQTSPQKDTILYQQLDTAQAETAKLIENLIQSSLSQTPTNLEYRKKAVRIYSLMGTVKPTYFNKAVSLMKNMIKKAKTDPKLYLNLALIYSLNNQDDKAQLYLKQAIDLKPNYDKAYYQLAQLYRQANKTAELSKLLNKWQANNPNSPTLKQMLKSQNQAL